MRYLAILLFFFSLISCGLAQESVELRWKLEPGETIRYKTVMNSIDESEFSFDFSKLFQIADGDQHNELEAVLQELNDAIKDIDFEAVISSEQEDIVDVVIRGLPVEGEESDDPMKKLFTGVQLRGSLHADGGIHSFWVKSNQKNLIALLFELPRKAVKVGDTWDLEVNFIANDHNFVCEKARKWGRAKLVDLENTDKGQVAVIRYDFGERVEGTFNMPSMGPELPSRSLSMEFTHYAVARFSVDAGRWTSYEGLLTLKADGVMNSDQKTKLTLLPKP